MDLSGVCEQFISISLAKCQMSEQFIPYDIYTHHRHTWYMVLVASTIASSCRVLPLAPPSAFCAYPYCLPQLCCCRVQVELAIINAELMGGWMREPVKQQFKNLKKLAIDFRLCSGFDLFVEGIEAGLIGLKSSIFLNTKICIQFQATSRALRNLKKLDLGDSGLRSLPHDVCMGNCQQLARA